MTKKTTKKSSSNTSSQGGRSLIGTIIGLVIVAAAALIFNLTGIDLLGLSGGTATQPVTQSAPVTPPTAPPAVVGPTTLTTLQIGQGFGYEKDFWQLYFNAPTGSSDAATYVNGIDVPLARAIGAVRRTLDIAAFEMNNAVITQAILDAHNRGAVVRIVTDDEHGINDDKTTLRDLRSAGIQIVDDGRSGLMHNKFMILDSQTVWTGSWNYTINGTYRNNNNAFVMRAPEAVASYQAEFDEMFSQKRFGTTSPTGNSATFTRDGTTIEIYFAAEDDVKEQIVEEVSKATSAIRFMAFSFTQNDIGSIMIERSAAGVNVSGIFENRGSETESSELKHLFCAGIAVRQDGNRYVLHHKVIIIDRSTVITGSFNFSDNAIRTNDENLIIIKNRDIAARYIEEFDRMWGQAKAPTDVAC